MRKWTYLVAALLMSGATATFTGCIDTDEPAGIEELRGAKAELLRAKAAVEQAEAAIRTAQAAWVQAQADIAAQQAAREALLTALQEAQNEKQIAEIQQQMQIKEAEFQKDLLNKQQAIAEAQAAYDKAIAEIEVAMLGYKENLYAQQLNDLLNSNTYTVDLPNGTSTATQLTFVGLKDVSTSLSSAKDNLATLNRELLKLQYSYDKNTIIAATQSELAAQQGVLEGMQENLALYQDILNTEDGDLGKLNARYTEIKDKQETLNAEKNQLALQLEETLQPIRASQDSLTKENAAVISAQFAVPEAIQDDVYQWANTATPSAYVWNAIKDQGVEVEGEYTYPEGITLEGTKAALYTAMDEFIGEFDDKIITDANMSAFEAQLAQLEAEYAEYIKKDGTGTYDKALKAWSDAKTAYAKAYNDNKWYDKNNNPRTQIIKDFEQFQDDLDAAQLVDLDSQSKAVAAFQTKLNDYLTARAELDGFEPTTEPTFDNLLDESWWTTSLTTDDDRFGEELGASYTIANAEGLLGEYYAAAEAMGYDATVNPADEDATQAEITYEEWEEISTPKPAGIMTDAYTARQEAEEMASTVNNQAAWKEFLANVENDFAEVTEKYTAALDRAKELTEATDAATAARQAGLAKIDQQLAGLSNIAAQIQTILNDELGGTSASVENLIAWVESEVNKLNGGGVTTSGDDYTFNTTGSIPAQEAVIASLEALLADLQAENGSFQAAAERAIERKQEAIAWQQAVVDATQALFDQLNALKDQYIAGMTGEAAPAE